MNRYFYTVKMNRFTTLVKFQPTTPEQVRHFIVDQQNENPKQRLSVQVFTFDNDKHKDSKCINKSGACPFCYVETNTIILKSTQNFGVHSNINEETP